MYVVADLKFLTIVIILFKPNFSLEIGPHDVGEVGIRKVGQSVYHPANLMILLLNMNEV